MAQLQSLIACVEQRCAVAAGLAGRTGTTELWLTPQDLADMLGVTRQTVDRLLSHLEVGKILQDQRGAVTIKDRSKLLDRACDCYHIIAKRLNALVAP